MMKAKRYSVSRRTPHLRERLPAEISDSSTASSNRLELEGYDFSALAAFVRRHDPEWVADTAPSVPKALDHKDNDLPSS
jgi:hypothetical protein